MSPRVIVFDVEATCWREAQFNKQKETIELGAVRYLAGEPPEAWPAYQTFVRPVRHPKLSSFCTSLTGIAQADVDGAPPFPAAFLAFLEWSKPLEETVFASWSPYDVWQLDLDLTHHGLPKLALAHLDVKKLASRALGRKSFEATARALDVPLPEGRHRALGDARTTAAILDRLSRKP